MEQTQARIDGIEKKEFIQYVSCVMVGHAIWGVTGHENGILTPNGMTILAILNRLERDYGTDLSSFRDEVNALYEKDKAARAQLELEAIEQRLVEQD